MKYATIDTETTGVGKGKNGRLVQVAILCYNNGKVVDRYKTYINPQCRIPTQAYAVHHIGWRKVRHAPTAKQAAPAIRKKLQGYPLVIGYNVSFDKRMMEQNGIPIHRGRRVEDVMHTCKEAGYKKCKLVDMAKKTGISTKGMNLHDAFTDASLTGRIYEKMRGRIRRKKKR